jgi:hypothetical protein
MGERITDPAQVLARAWRFYEKKGARLLEAANDAAIAV